MPRSSLRTRFLSLLLIISLPGAPVWAGPSPDVSPLQAAASEASEPHAHHQSNHPAGDSLSLSCEWHNHCDGYCCAVCAQCLSALQVSGLQDTAWFAVQIAHIPQLCSQQATALRYRPPLNLF